MIDFHNAKYIKSVPDISYRPEKKYPEILFVGKSNVGKSSLINALTNNASLARVSATPGATKYLNYFLIDNKYYLIDAPGYGFVSDKKLEFNKMMDSIFTSPELKGVVFILDPRRSLNTMDKVFYNMLIDKKVPFFIVLSKADKINQREKSAILKDIKKNFVIVLDNEIIFTSSKNKDNIKKLREKCEILLKS